MFLVTMFICQLCICYLGISGTWDEWVAYTLDKKGIETFCDILSLSYTETLSLRIDAHNVAQFHQGSGIKLEVHSALTFKYGKEENMLTILSGSSQI